MDIDSISHKGLARFFEMGNAKGFVGDRNRIRKMLAFINAAGSFDELSAPPNYGLDELVADRAGRWTMTVTVTVMVTVTVTVTVTKNWRLTFIKRDDMTIADLNLEDYH